MIEVQVFSPVPDEGPISDGLRVLTEAIHRSGAADGGPGGIFGGEFGYGADYENAVFMMHRYCWCDNDKFTVPGQSGPNPPPGAPYCPWCTGCNCEDASGERRRWLDKNGRDVGPDAYFKLPTADQGECIHGEGCIYFDGGRPAPNFLHKASGSRISWYKYIGRDMEIQLRADWTAVLSDCLASLALSASGKLSEPVPTEER